MEDVGIPHGITTKTKPIKLEPMKAFLHVSVFEPDKAFVVAIFLIHTHEDVLVCREQHVAINVCQH
jgi:hypothetical protein